MKNIKFRAWDRICKKMRKVVAIDLLPGDKITILDDDSQKTYYFDVPRKDYPLMQGASLEDKNGKAIFEGDIVRKKSTMGSDLFLVLYNAYDMSFCYIEPIEELYINFRNEAHTRHRTRVWNFEPNTEIEIVGNIFENPTWLSRDIETIKNLQAMI